MAKSISVNQNKKRMPGKRGPGRPRTGRDPVVALRLPKKVIEEVDKFAKEQKVERRSEALRRLIEEALAKRERGR